MNTFILSCDNGYCRHANSRNLKDAISEAKELRNCIGVNVSLYEVLDWSSWKLIYKFDSNNSKEN